MSGFEYLLHESDIEILKEIRPQRQRSKMSHNHNMEHHQISTQTVLCGVVQRDKYYIQVWNNVREYRESGFEVGLEG